MGECVKRCDHPFGSSQSTSGTSHLKSDGSLIDENMFGERISKAFSPPKNRLAPLLGKKLFMHYESGTLRDKQVEHVLKKLKGEVVEFFSRDVHYVITNRPSPRLPSVASGEESLSAPLKKSISLQNQHSTSQVLSSLKVPVLTGSKSVNNPVTRGRAMLLAARKIATEDSIATPSSRTASSVLSQVQASNDTSSIIQSSQPSLTSNTLGCSQWSNSNTDLLFKARQLGIKILTIDTVNKWIKNLPSDVQSYIQSVQRGDNEDQLNDVINDPERDRLHEVRHLVSPCIKVIDTKNHYRPIYLDKTDYLPELWNLVDRYKSKSKSSQEIASRGGVQDCSSSPMPLTSTTTNVGTPVAITTTIATTAAMCSGSVPGASVGFAVHNPSHLISGTTGTQSVLTRKGSRAKRKYRLQKHNTATPLQRTASLAVKGIDSNPKANSTIAAVHDEPSGYCECCSVNFKSLFEHLHCTEHLQFANNSENYRLLDDVLNKLPTIQEFLKATKTSTTISNNNTATNASTLNIVTTDIGTTTNSIPTTNTNTPTTAVAGKPPTPPFPTTTTTANDTSYTTANMTTLQSSSYLNPISISPVLCKSRTDYLFDVLSKDKREEKENVTPVPVSIYADAANVTG
nr:unnamed protein product [Trichobilharzia regenti]